MLTRCDSCNQKGRIAKQNNTPGQSPDGLFFPVAPKEVKRCLKHSTMPEGGAGQLDWTADPVLLEEEC